MIYFQLHYSPAPWHMVLSITLVTIAEDQQRSETLSETERVTEKSRKKENKSRESEGLRNLVGTNSYFHCWLASGVRGSRDTHQNEWNYWAFIKQTAGLLRSLKAAGKHSPPARFPAKILLCFSMRDLLGCYAAAKTKQIDQSVKHRIELYCGYLLSILSLIRAWM